MRALVKSKPGRGLDLVDVPDPVPRPGEVLIRVGASGVCGSDVARYVWSRNYEAGAAKDMTRDLPRILGHEISGLVVELGPKVSTINEGDRVAVQNILGCWRCGSCRRGMPNVCDTRRTIGVHRDGGYAELCAVPEANCTRIADSVSLHLAASMQPFAVATNAVALADLAPGDRILVWGLGPIGLATIAAARLRGAEVALGIDISPIRIEEAEAFGVPTLDVREGDPAAAVRAALGPRSIDAAFEAAGAPAAVEATFPVLRKSSPLVLIGNLKDRVDVDLMPLIMDQQVLIGSRSYSLEMWDVAVRTIGRSGYEATLGDEVSLGEAIERFDMAAAGDGRAFTILPNGPEAGMA